MGEMGLSATSSYRKCAAIVGEVMGKYHPHGDQCAVRRARPPRPGLLDALPARRRPGQLRLGRRRRRRRDALHGGAPDARSPPRCSPTSTRRPSTSSTTTTARRSSRRSCRRSCRTCSSTARSGIAVGMATNIPPHHLGEIVRRDDRPHRRPRAHLATTCASSSHGPDFPTGRHDLPLRAAAQRADRRVGDGRRHPADVRPRPRPGRHARPGRLRGGPRRPDRDHRHRAAVPGEQGEPAREDRRPGQGQADRRDRATCATSPTATGCASTSRSSATRTRTRC